jgi:hypothetical protein
MMDYKVRRIYVSMLAKERYNNYWKSDADETLRALIDFKRRYPTRKCLYWVDK